MLLPGAAQEEAYMSGRPSDLCTDSHVYDAVLFYNLVFQPGNLVLSGGYRHDLYICEILKIIIIKNI